jgi:transposase
MAMDQSRRFKDVVADGRLADDCKAGGGYGNSRPGVHVEQAMSRAIHANRAQVFLLPPSIDEWVSPAHPAPFVADMVEALDLEAMGFRVSPGEEGRPHYAPELLLALWLYGLDGACCTAGRALEKACQRDLGFVWLTSNLRPDHNTLWRFFRDNKQALTKLFKRVVVVAANVGLVGFALYALDGTKVRVASSMDMAWHRKSLDQQLGELDQVVDTTVAQIEADEQQQTALGRCPSLLQTSKSGLPGD